ncbi:MAG: flagellar hook-associated protein FlgK [Planctomycetales bacterium]|nr:flagellar hook-associated protein FlgK [Planctomycetales bacterium]
MSLFAAIQNSANALQVAQLGLHVVGNNISNANTPGYIRQELVQVPTAGVKVGDTILGYGVRAKGVEQKIDNFILARLRQVQSDLSSSEAIDESYSRLEAILGELTDTDISSQLSDFASAINDVLNQPGNDALRRLVVERGTTLAGKINNTARQLDDISVNLTQEVRGSVDEINRLTEQIAKLNRRIVELEGGRTSGSDAVGLRDERIALLQELSSIVDVRAEEQASGSVTVLIGGEYLVAEGIYRPVKFAYRTDGEEVIPEVRLADTDSPIRAAGGRLHGLLEARENAIGSALDNLDTFARDLIEQFNLIHSQGQGLDGFREVTGTYVSDDPSGPLDLSGYAVGLKNGQFEIQVKDFSTGLSTTHTIRVKLTGSADDSSLEDVRQSIEAIAGLNASITSEGALRIESDNEKLEFSFQNDSSNFLAAAGINTFFVGDTANSIAVNNVIASDPRKFAASLSGIGSATDNALLLANSFDSPLETLGGQSIKQAYESIVVETTQDINVQAGVSDGLRSFYRTLEGEHLAVSGVNLDEEAIKMIFYQRAFQASSRVIQASDEMLQILVSL